jgi:capsular polysaccharide biosynthesis protein
MGRKLDRKISNEDQVVKALEEVSRGRASFSSVQLETMTFKEQVELMYSKTNILIGVHGAGLSHTVFLPPEVLLPSFVDRSCMRACAMVRVRWCAVRVRVRVGEFF